jgi:hypothetical protein
VVCVCVCARARARVCVRARVCDRASESEGARERGSEGAREKEIGALVRVCVWGGVCVCERACCGWGRGGRRRTGSKEVRKKRLEGERTGETSGVVVLGQFKAARWCKGDETNEVGTSGPLSAALLQRQGGTHRVGDDRRAVRLLPGAYRDMIQHLGYACSA